MLPKINRLSKEDFEIAFKKRGKFLKKGFLKLKLVQNNLDIIRFGISCGAKISNKASRRNRIKRQLNEIVRLNFASLESGYDILIIPEPEIIQRSFQETSSLLIEALQELGIMKTGVRQC